MFRPIYEACLVVFLLQGVLLLPLTILAGFAWHRQSARLDAIGAALGRDRRDQERTLASLLAALPKLRPLHCASCGSALALDVATTVCTSCHGVAAPPPDYAATLSLRRRLTRLAAIATRHWYLARILTSAPARWFFFLMIFAEPAIFGICVVGAASYRDSWADRALEGMSEGWTLALGLSSFGGFILWIVLFVMLTNLSRDLRRTLPPFPAIARDQAGPIDYAECQACGGGIHYAQRAFAALCGWCGVENLRVEQGRRERAAAEGDRATARATLFGAMEIIEGFTATFFFAMAILISALALLVLLIALGD